ncbi:hypothetical protein DPEC_G00152500 [Dallia pectoralis]|uniref:Uncharacterized protein n=1 Tax=Dallia pectoralis TaxID=75939 RepID=A0ACC2GJW9_DALPE|nr:hypothetical protein DPEC_G00152500 [Dallia pectoralis]
MSSGRRRGRDTVGREGEEEDRTSEHTEVASNRRVLQWSLQPSLSLSRCRSVSSRSASGSLSSPRHTQ